MLSASRSPAVSISDTLRTERHLATARAVLAISSLAAVIIDPSEPTRFVELAYGLFVVYAACSVGLLLWLSLAGTVKRRSVRVVHGADVCWPVLITLFTEGPSSAFFLFFLFVVVAAAYRWGLRETVLTAGVTTLLLFVETAVVAASVDLGSEAIELNRVVMRGSYLLLMGFLVGYLAEEEKKLRTEKELVARLLMRATRNVGLREALRGTLAELIAWYGSTGALLSLQESGEEACFIWRLAPGTGGETALTLQRGLPPHYLFDAPELFSVAPDGPTGVRDTIPPAFLESHPFESLYAVSFFRDPWRGRLFLLDPEPRMPAGGALELLRTVVSQVAPAVESVYLSSRLRAQASALERARVARELHDGAIQSLIAVEMEVEASRRMGGRGSRDLARLRDVIRGEVMNLRDLMHELKPMEIDAQGLVSHLSETCERFQRETGITARWVADSDPPSLPTRVCGELARILREALVNVRKHSGAKNVIVRLSSENGRTTLVVDDDGVGFPFSGDWPQDRLDAERRGPVVIRERVRAIDGRIRIDSTPGRGARLEVSWGKPP